MAHIVKYDSRITVAEFTDLSARRFDVVLSQTSTINRERGGGV